MKHNFKNLKIWILSMEIASDIHKITLEFPKNEVYGLISQMNRAAVSIPSNIAEGSARKGNKEFAQFLYIGLGSLSELETQLIISSNLKYISSERCELIMNDLNDIRRMLVGLIKYVKAKT